MRFRRTATVMAATMAAAACSSGPELTKAQSAKVVTAALEGCDSAVNVLTVNREHATDTGLYQMAQVVESECQGATLAMMRANLPEPIRGTCRDASEAARVMAGDVETALNSRQPGDEVRAESMVEASASQRSACDSSLT